MNLKHDFSLKLTLKYYRIPHHYIFCKSINLARHDFLNFLSTLFFKTPKIICECVKNYKNCGKK